MDEVLRGRVARGAHAAQWEAPMRGDEYVREPDGSIRMKPEWYERPLPPPAAGGAYAVYESGISSDTNIRVDLLAVVPALAAMALIAIVTPIVDLIRGRGGRGPTATAARTRSS